MSVDALPSREDTVETSHIQPRFDSTEVMTPIDDDTAVMTPVAPAKYFDPIVAGRPQATNPSRDPASTAEAELIIYECGTTSPGYVHDPCQHSTVQVLCCTCAGCMFDLWSCNATPPSDGWLWWEAQQMGARWDPWVRHPYAMVLYALVAIFLLVSHIIVDLVYVMIVLGALMFSVFAYGLHSMIT